jgi:hypothetical protein
MLLCFLKDSRLSMFCSGLWQPLCCMFKASRLLTWKWTRGICWQKPRHTRQRARMWMCCVPVPASDQSSQVALRDRGDLPGHGCFPWIFESNCTSWRFLQTQQWFVTKFWSRCCWLVSLSSAGYIWIIQVLLDVPFWGFQWISNITNPDGCWTSYRIVVGWWDDISLPLSSLHSLWLETRLKRQNMYFLCFKSQKVDVWIIFLNVSAPIFDDWFRSPQRDDSRCVFMCFSAGSGSKQLQTEWTDFSNQNH